MVEIWKDIKGYETIYQVSNMGRIKNKKTDKILKLKNNKGYLRVGLSKNGERKDYSVHRLVAFAFPEICGEWFENAEINHKDTNPLNNNTFNLEWVTNIENNQYYLTRINRKNATQKRIENGTWKCYLPNNKGRKNGVYSKPVRMLDKNHTPIMDFESVKAAAKYVGTNPKNISNALNGWCLTSCGYVWEKIA